ncbi:hypothetical protein ACFQ0P_05735 [Microbacterium insulae]|uniref:Alpha/beta hydrolase n=1 Tax=Microbacterium insulae TaxID=483014 RepID=A0ABW3AG64_9MICO
MTSSDLEILGGGAVAVDTETLRDTAGRFASAADYLGGLRHRLGCLQNMLHGQDQLSWEAVSAASVLSRSMADSIAGARRIADALREAAAIYELVEINAEHRAAVFAGDRPTVERLDARRDELMDLYPDANGAALGADFERAVMWPSDLVRQATENGMIIGEELDRRVAIFSGAAAGLGTIALGAIAGVGGTGRLARDARLTGSAEPVSVTPVAVRTPTAAPTSLADAAARVPTGGTARVRVETYTMADGSRQYAVYVAGMQSSSVGGRDPWDNLSNAQLYSGRTSASYEATTAALEDAGARPGDVVHAFGHSQGAMITSHLALEGGYDTRTHVTFGSPVEADVGPGTLSVGLRHTDDPVAALAGGGHVAPVGTPGSFIVEREADPASGVHDGTIPAHRLSAYAETAALADASGDPRVEVLHSTLADLDRAVSVEAVEYTAERLDG